MFIQVYRRICVEWIKNNSGENGIPSQDNYFTVHYELYKYVFKRLKKNFFV